jgi:hypothetical protein
LISALNITPDLIFNVDETLFYPRLQFQSTIVPMEEARKLRGGKPNSHLTALFCMAVNLHIAQ